MKKKIIITISIIIVSIISIIAYMVIKDLKEENKLLTELTEINNLTNEENLDIDEINKRLDRIVTTKDYAKVEESYKTYLKDNFTNMLEIADLLSDERMTNLLTPDNYKTDGKDFTNSKNYLTTTKEQLKACKEKYTNYLTKETAMSYIQNKDLDSYYLDLYEEELVKDMINHSDTVVEDSIDEIIALLDTTESILNLLSNNQNAWTLAGDNIVFSNSTIKNQYNELIDSIG